MAYAEFPLSEADAQADALLLLAGCTAADAQPWAALLALMLSDTEYLAGEVHVSGWGCGMASCFVRGSRKACIQIA